MRAWAALAALVLAAPASAAVRPHPQIPVGGFPTGIAVDPATHTIYVGNGTTNSLSVIDARTCNARVATGCGRRASAATGGFDPIGIAVDDSTDTVYVANASGTVAVLDTSRCRAGRAAGCSSRPRTVPVGLSPQFLALDRRTHTLYVANTNSNTVSVIDERRCNARLRTGCGTARATIPVAPAPFAVAVNDATGSVYVAELTAPRVAVIDGTTCNATDTSGCGHRPATVVVGGFPGGIAIDARTDTVYVTGQASNDVALIDGRACNGRSPAGCRRPPVRVPAGPGARGIALDPRTRSVYIADTAGDAVTVLDEASCNAATHTGCSHAGVAPVGISPRRVAVDAATDTIYVTNAGSDTVSILDGRTCNARARAGCRRAVRTA